MKALTLIAADDEFLGDEALEQVRERFTARGFTQEERSAKGLQDLFYSLETPSLLGGGRLVVVKDGAELSGESLRRIAAWAGAPADGVALVLLGGTKMKKSLADVADVIEIRSVRFREAEWVTSRMKRLGRRITREGALALVEAVGSDLRELATAIDQLLTTEADPIDVPAVSALFRGIETEIWNFVDAVFDRDRPAAFARLGSLLARGENAIGLVTALANQLRLIAIAREAGRTPVAALARELGVKEGKLRRALRQARNVEGRDIRRAFRLLADADVALKGGDRGEDEPDALVLELLVAELVGGEALATPRR